MPERALTERKAAAYDPRFDLNAITSLQASKPQLPHGEYSRRLNQLLDRTRTNLITNLGERFSVEISTITYEQNPQGKLINHHHDEPFEEIIKRGVDYRLRNGNPKDKTREEAELLGFLRAQELLKDIPTVVIISPRGETGSDYRHNFADIYNEENGQIIMRRLIIKSNYQESYIVARTLDPNLPAPTKLTDNYFLSHPLVTNKPIEEVIRTLSQSENTMRNQDFQKLVASCEPAIAKYIEDLIKNCPENTINDNYKGLLKLADLLTSTDTYTQNHQAKIAQFQKMAGNWGIGAALKNLGAEPIRQVATGCGSQGGLETNRNNSPWSVSEFRNSNEQEWFQCPKCRYKANGPVGNTCPGCGLTKEQYAQEARIACT